MSHIRRGTVAAIAVPLSALALLLPTAASADSTTLADPRADVWNAAYGDDGEPPVYTQAGHVPGADVRSVLTRHRVRSVAITTRIEGLARDNRVFATLVHLVRVGPGEPFNVQVNWDDDRPRGVASIYRPPETFPACPGIEAQVDYAGDEVTVVVPRPCLGRPDWVSTRTVYRGEGFTGRYPVDADGSRGHGSGLETPRLGRA